MQATPRRRNKSLRERPSSNKVPKLSIGCTTHQIEATTIQKNTYLRADPPLHKVLDISAGSTVRQNQATTKRKNASSRADLPPNKALKLLGGSTAHQNHLNLHKRSLQEEREVSPRHTRWTKAVCIFGKSVLPSSVKWSLNNFIAVMTEDAVHIVDAGAALEHVEEPKVVAVVPLKELWPSEAPKTRKGAISCIHLDIMATRSATFVVLAWSPVGCGPDGSPLLAVADSLGNVGVVSFSVNLTASGHGAKLIWNLTDKLKSGCVKREIPMAHQRLPCNRLREIELATVGEYHRSSCLPFSSSIKLAFCSSAISSSDGTSETVLCTAQGDMICVWRLNSLSNICVCLVVILVDECKGDRDKCEQCITGLAVSPLCKHDDNPDSFIITVGLGSGVVQLWSLRLSTSSSLARASEVSIVVEPCQELFGSCGSPVRQLSLGTNILKDASLHNDLEGSYVIAVAHDVAVSAVVVRPCSHESSAHRWTAKAFRRASAAHELPIISLLLDVSGSFANNDVHLFECAIRVISVDSSGHAAFWRLSTIPTCEVSLCESRNISPADSGEWLTPVEQVALKTDARVIKGAALGRDSKKVSVIYSSMTLSPSGSLFAMQVMAKSERTTQSKPMTFLLVAPANSPDRVFISLLWAACNALWKARHGEVFTLPIWDVAEAWYLLGVRKRTVFSRDGLKTPRDVIACLWNMLRDSHSSDVFFPHGKLQTLLENHLNIGLKRLGDRAAIHRCQIQNACLELVARLMIEKDFHQKILKSNNPLPDQTLLAASLKAGCMYDFWSQRLHSGWSSKKNGINPYFKTADGILKHARRHSIDANLTPTLAHDDLLVAPCKFCKSIAKPDKSLVTMSCARHKLRLCQWSLEPLVLESHFLCSMCGRATDCFQRYRENRSSGISIWDLPAAGVCAWCAACVSVIMI